MKKLELLELIREVVRESIRKVDGKFAVYPEKGGKRLGTHPTRKAAQKQLTAIHLNKEQSEEGTVNIVLQDIKGRKVVLAIMDGEKLGALRLKPYLNSYQVDSILIKPEYHKMGIGTEMYRLAHEKLGTLYSDANPSPAAKALWDSLVRKGEAKQEGERYRMLQGTKKQ